MGFLDNPDNPTPPPADTPQQNYGGFLSENPPPSPPAAPEKVPSWSEVPAKALVNAPESAYEFGKNIVHTVSHPIDSLEGLGKLGLGLIQKTGILPKDNWKGNYEEYPEAVGKMLMDRYGSEENIKKTLAKDPVGVAADLSTILMGPEALLRDVPVVGKIASAARAATDPLTLPTAAVKGAGHVATAGLGYTTGAAMRPIEQAAKAGYEGGDAFKTFEANRTGAVEGSELVHDAYQALNNIKKDRGSAYELGMQSVKADQSVLSWNDIIKTLQDSRNVKSYKGVDLMDARGAKMRDALDKEIFDWAALPPKDFHTAEGFDALKKKLGNILEAQEPGSAEAKVAGMYYNAVKNTIKKQVPEYSKVMERYADVSSEVQQLEKAFSLPKDQRRLNVDSALRRLSSVLRKNVNTNFGQREKLLDWLEREGNAPNLRNAIAGQALQSPEAHGLARVAPALIAGRVGSLKELGHAVLSLGAASPRAAGYLASRAGMAARPFKYVPPKSLQAAQEAGRWNPETQEKDGRLYVSPQNQNRGGAVDRALRAAKRH